ncbi:MAG TPA: DNA-formamidopyrimidine glycosylase family protein [Polyangiaceae bacterium]
MPEGDTLARIAITLREALAGQRVEHFRSPIPALRDTGLEGRTIESVESRGKHLLIRFDDGRTLHTHLRMSGEWLLFPRAGPTARDLVAIETSDRAAVLRRRPGAGAPPIVRLLSEDALRRDRVLRSLGPDVLASDFDAHEAARRLRASIRPTIAEALLDQRDVAGIGNEWKSELLFLSGIDPRTPPSDVSDARWLELLGRARELLTKNVSRGKSGRFAIVGRASRFAPGPSKWVYGRAGRPCLRCGAPIRFLRQGLDRRSTYHCPRCQR